MLGGFEVSPSAVFVHSTSAFPAIFLGFNDDILDDRLLLFNL